MPSDTVISEREREILRLVAMGATNQQIAQQLDISINTVKVHLRNIFGKIGVASRTEATVYAIREGLVVVDGRGAAPAVVLDEPPIVSEAPAAVELASASVLPVVEQHAVEPAPSPARPRRLPVMLAALAVVALLGATVAVFVLRQPAPAVPAAVTPAAAPDLASRWRTRAPLARERSDFGVTPLDGRLYVVGGGLNGVPSAAVDRYDPANNVWVELTDKPTAVSHVKAVAIGRSIYVPGGEAADGRALDVLEAYDSRTQQWESLPSLPAPRSRYALASYEGRLYLFGGWDGTRYCDEVFVYDPAARAWTEDPQKLPTPRRDAGAAVVEGRAYVLGGEDGSGALRTNERYDPTGASGQRWESLTPLPQAAATPGAVGVLDVVLVFDPAQGAAAQYTPRTDSWAAVELPPGTPLSSRATFLGTSVFVFGGAAGDAPVALSEYQAIYTTFLPGTTGSER